MVSEKVFIMPPKTSSACKWPLRRFKWKAEWLLDGNSFTATHMGLQLYRSVSKTVSKRVGMPFMKLIWEMSDKIEIVVDK